MIREITSNLPSFKNLTFQSGLNILVAEKSEGATDKQSRNGAGKSSFIEIIHFLLGADVLKNGIFSTDALQEYTFFLEFDLGGMTTQVGRSCLNPSEIQIIKGASPSWPFQPKAGNIQTISNAKWRQVLGYLMFRLDTDEKKGTLSFRQLFPYFARRQSVGGFHDYRAHVSKQQNSDSQIALSYLIGLDWTIPKRLQEIKVKEKSIRELRKAIREGAISDFSMPLAELKTRITVTQAKLHKLQKELSEFKVIDQYYSLEQEANDLTLKINLLSDENTTDSSLLSGLEESVQQEEPPTTSFLEQMYHEAGIFLPEKVTKRFADVIEFHRIIIENRCAHLQSEIDQAKKRLDVRKQEMSKYDARRSQIMKILQVGGALESYTRLQEELARTEAEAEILRKNLSLVEEIESKKTQATIDRAQIYQRLQQDHHEQSRKIQQAILIFEDISSALYEKAGSLMIDATENGPMIGVTIEAERSKGINNMQIFCFDIMLAILNHMQGRGSGFLIHDSHLFDGVDERQIAKALQVGHQKAQQYGFQYIVTLNSDILPKTGYQNNFDVNNFVVQPLLTDYSETGGLFGFRFN